MEIKYKYFILSKEEAFNFVLTRKAGRSTSTKCIYLIDGDLKDSGFDETYIIPLATSSDGKRTLFKLIVTENNRAMLFGAAYISLMSLTEVFAKIPRPTLTIELYYSVDYAMKVLNKNTCSENKELNTQIVIPSSLYAISKFFLDDYWEEEEKKHWQKTNEARKAGLLKLSGQTETKQATPIKVIFNNPATIVFWSDGRKTVVKTQDGEKFDPEKGLTMALCKGYFSGSNPSHWYDFIKENVKEYEKKFY